MAKVLPKGHRSCLSEAFRYTPAVHTNIANTFARIKAELAKRGEAPASKPRPRIALASVVRDRPSFDETIEAAQRLLRAGGPNRAPMSKPSA